MPAAWDRRSVEEQRRVEELGLADWLPGATSFAPYWASRASVLDIDPTELVTRTDLLRFPPSLQGDVAARGATALVQRPTEAQVKQVASSSLLADVARAIRRDQRDGKRRILLEQFKPVHVTRGGVGDQLAIASSRADLDRLHRTGARAASVLGLDDADYLVSAVPAGPTDEYWAVHTMALGASILALQPRGHGDDLDRCVEAFELVPATAVAVRPDEAVAWARVLRRANADVSRVITVVLVGPPPGADLRGEIEEAWRGAGALEHELVVRAIWSPDVHRTLWAECRRGTTGLHTQPDLEVLETLDAVTGTTTDGGGDLTLTTLGWSGTTLVRYRTGVRVGGLTGADHPCVECQRSVPRVTGAVEPAAWQPLVRLGGDRLALDLRAVATELDGAPGRSWRVVVRDDGYVVEVGGHLTEDAQEDLADLLERATGIRPVIDVERDVDAVTAKVRAQGSPFSDART